MTLILFIFGIGLLVVGAELLVRGAARLAIGVGLSPLVVGLTVVAFGTSSPELAVALRAALAGQGDLVIGNVVGSNIANVLLILGLAALIAPLSVAQKLIRLDVPLLIGVSAALWLLARDGVVSRGDGLLLVAGIVGYTIFAIVQSRRESARVQQEYAAEYGAPHASSAGRLADLALIGAGLVALALGARWIVDGAVAFARAVGVDELVIGLTVVAVGTSLPEIAATVVASMRGERDIAVGNVVGSCLFNILSVLGVAALVAPGGVAVAETALRFDLPVMLVVTAACLPIFWRGLTISRWEGALLLSAYVAYTTYVVLSATGSPVLPLFTSALLGLGLPLAGLLLLAPLLRRGRSAPALAAETSETSEGGS